MRRNTLYFGIYLNSFLFIEACVVYGGPLEVSLRNGENKVVTKVYYFLKEEENIVIKNT